MKNNVIGKIYETTNYEMFQLRNDNRPIKDQNVNALISSIKNMGLRHPIAVDNKYRVQDGQHRLAACKALKIPVAYIVDENTMTTAEIAELQSASKSWNHNDYAHSFSTTDNGDSYRLYQDFKTIYPEFSHSVILIMLTGINYTSEKVIEAFKNGTFTVKSYSKAKIIAETLKKLAPFYKGYNRRSFVLSIIYMMTNKDFTLERLLRKMPARCKQIMDFSKMEDYVDTLQDMYNWKETKKVYFI
jgi:hypothetical protein